MIASLPVQKAPTVLLWLTAPTLPYIHMAVIFTIQEQKQGLLLGSGIARATVWKTLTEGGRDCKEESKNFGFCSERLGEAGMWWAEEKGGATHILNVSVALCWEQNKGATPETSFWAHCKWKPKHEWDGEAYVFWTQHEGKRRQGCAPNSHIHKNKEVS